MDTSFTFGDPRAQIVWAKKLFGYAMPNIMMTPLMGSNGNAFIHVNKELLKRPGKEVVFEAEEPLTGAGEGDDGDTRDNAQAIKMRNMTVRIHARSTRTQATGKLSLQLTSIYGPSGFREKSRSRLGKWVTECIENDLITCAAGLYNENSSSGDIETINHGDAA